jgi:hypothetical protein
MSSTTLRRRGVTVATLGTGLALALASPAAAAVNGSIAATGLNAPATVKIGADLWVADHVSGFCRLDPAATGKLTINAATCNTAAPAPGQPSFDPATNSVYVPDNSTQGTGVVRLAYNPATRTVAASGKLTTGPAGSKPTATTLSADGSTLYVGSIKSGNIVKVDNPSGSILDPATGTRVPVAPTVNQAFGTTSDGRGAAGLAIANHSNGTPGSSLYVAEGGGVSELDLATGGAAFLTGIVPSPTVNGKVIAYETLDVVAASPNVLYVAKWAPHDFGPKVTIVQATLSTGANVDYSNSYTAPDGKLQPWTTVTDLSLNPAGGLYVSHDPTNGGTNGAVVSSLA